MLPTTLDPLISISLDLAGSTEAKAAILRAKNEDPDDVAQCYESLFRQFFHHEAGFYLHLLSGGILLEAILLVKTIGDEIWTVVTCPRPEIGRRALTVIQASLDTVTKTISVPCLKRRPSEDEMTDPGSPNPGREHQPLGIKAYVDLFERPYEVTKLRSDAFLESLAEFTHSGAGVQPVLERLGGFGLNMLGGTRASLSYRTDFIGFEVDRFFRCSKFAQAGQLKIGRTLARALLLEEGTALPPCDGAPADVTFAVSETGRHTLRLSRECIRRDDLKGIGQGYALFRVEDPSLPPGI